MNNEELNMKLLERAGFEKGDGWRTFKKEGGTLYIETTDWWKTPKVGNYWGEWEHLPNFTHSLDACFKWLVPKGDIEKIIFSYFTTWLACDIQLNNGGVLEGKANLGQEALALCLAIEKLIDGESS